MENIELLNRLIISQDDFLQAKRFIKYVLEKDLRYEANDEIRLVLKAFNTAIIVSYCRPFTRNHSSDNHPASPFLPKDYLELLTDNEKKLHKRILSIRNKEQAHSDADAHSVFLSDDSAFAIKRDATVPLEREEFIKLEKIIDKFLLEIINHQNLISK